MLTKLAQKPSTLSEHDRQHLLSALAGPLDQAGCTVEFSGIQGALMHLGHGEHYDRFLQALSLPKPLEGEKLRGALRSLSRVGQASLPTAVELVRLHLPITDETLAIGEGLRGGSPEYTRKLFFNLKALRILRDLNSGRLEPPQTELLDGLRPDADTIMMMQTSLRYLNIPSHAFRDNFNVGNMKLQPPEDVLESYLLATGFTRDGLDGMHKEQRYAIWNKRLDVLRQGFERPPEDRQQELPGLL